MASTAACSTSACARRTEATALSQESLDLAMLEKPTPQGGMAIGNYTRLGCQARKRGINDKSIAIWWEHPMNASAVKPSTWRPLNILLADDERDAILTLSTLLIQDGHSVSAVYSGNDVLQSVRRYKPDVCILDIEMPGKSGYAAAREMSAALAPELRPVLIAISGKWTETTDRLLGLSLGFDHYFLKPVDPQRLLGFLDDIANGKADPR
jgi:CheY-like chemotaxis protein